MGLLQEPDDWSFVIKAHAVIEAATAYMLAAAIRKPLLSDTLARLELSNNSTGKLAFISALDLLSKPVRRFIKKFSELRNELVHNVRNAGFTFAAYEGSLNAEQRIQFWKAITGSMQPAGLDPLPDLHQRMLESPRSAIWLSVILIVVLAELEQAGADLAGERDRLREEHFASLTALADGSDGLLGLTTDV
jgi:hypothetical protein